MRQDVTRQFITDTSPAAPGTAAGASVIPDVGDFDQIKVVGDLQGATGGTLDVYVQFFDGEDWIDVVHFAQLAPAAAAVTVSCSLVRSSVSSSPETVGKALTPALAVDTVVMGDFGEQLRLVFVAGAGTTVGAAQTLIVVGKRRT